MSNRNPNSITQMQGTSAQQRCPRLVRRALQRLSKHLHHDFLELGPNNSIEEEALSEVIGTYGTGSDWGSLYVFPEQLASFIGNGSVAAVLAAYLVRCGDVQTVAAESHYVTVPFEIWVGPGIYTHSYILKRDCLVVKIDEMEQLAAKMLVTR